MSVNLIQTIKAGDILGEGPVWDHRASRLWWTDIQNRRLRTADPATGEVRSVATPERVGSYALVAGQPDLLLCAFETGFAYFDVTSGAVNWLARPEAGETGRRFNDGRVDRAGRFWAGTMVEHKHIAEPASASLWRLAGAGEPVLCETGVQISNGLAFSPDGRTLYFADSPHQRIFAYDLDPGTGAISGKRLFAAVERGYPDGATVDAEGCLWSARWGAGEVVRHAPDGRELTVVKTPASQPTCVAFGGDDLSLMFVTSASEDLTPEQLAVESGSGDVFVFDVGVKGLPEVEFRAEG